MNPKIIASDLGAHLNNHLKAALVSMQNLFPLAFNHFDEIINGII